MLEVYSRFRRHEVTVCVDTQSLQEADSSIAGKLPSFRSVVGAHYKPGPFLPGSIAKLASMARKMDAVVCYDEFPQSVVYAYLVARLSRKPLIIFYHIIIPATARRFSSSAVSPLSVLYKRAIRYSSAAICLDNGKEDRILRSFFPDKPLYLAFNGAEKTVEWRGEADGNASDGLYLGVLQPRKGIMYFPEIWKHVSAEIPDARLKLIGKSVDNNANMLRSRFEASGIGRNLDVAGFVSEEKKRAALGNSKVFLFPSSDEGISLALLEALSNGIPAVLWELPVFDQFSEGVIKARFADTADYAEKVVRLLRDETLRKELGRKGKEWVEGRMSWERAAEREEEIFDGIASDLNIAQAGANAERRSFRRVKC